MDWGGITSIFLLSTVKFLFAPFAGVPLGLHFYETYFAAVIGGTVSSAFFYFGSGRLMAYFIKRAEIKNNKFAANGKKIREKKKFTRSNKFIARLRRNLGKVGICFWAPFFLSVPIGSIIAAKFYGGDKNTFLFIAFGMLFNGAITTFLAYVIFK